MSSKTQNKVCKRACCRKREQRIVLEAHGLLARFEGYIMQFGDKYAVRRILDDLRHLIRKE